MSATLPVQLSTVITKHDVKALVRAALQEVLTESGKMVDAKRPLDAYPLRLTLKQAAAALNISVTAVRNLIEEGQLTAVNIAPKSSVKRRLRVNRDSVAAFEGRNQS